MGFIIGICGFVLGIVVVALLATIGYFAEKNNANNLRNINTQGNVVQNNNVVKSDNAVSDDVPIDSGIVTFDELPNVNKKLNDIISDLSDSNIKKETSSEEKKEEEPVPSTVPAQPVVQNVDSNLTSDISEFSVSSDNVLSVNNASGVVETSSEVPSEVETPSETVSEVADNSNDVQSFSSSDFENVEMSLDDLEKKNFDELVNQSKNSDDENYYYSNMEEGSTLPIDEESNEDVEEKIIPENLGVPSVENNSLPNEETTDISLDVPVEVTESVDSPVEKVQENIPDASVEKEQESIPSIPVEEVPENIFDAPIEEVQEIAPEVSSVSNVEPVENGEAPEVMDNHAFDEEVSPLNSDDSQSNDVQNVQQFSEDVEVPEIGENGFSVVNDDSTDDDIWKF